MWGWGGVMALQLCYTTGWSSTNSPAEAVWCVVLCQLDEPSFAATDRVCCSKIQLSANMILRVLSIFIKAKRMFCTA